MSVRKRELRWRSDLQCLEDRQLLSLTLSLVANDISPLQGKQFNGAVATLIDLNLTAQPSNFTVSIVWQNGQPPTSGTVAKASIPGTFEVEGSNTYPQVGTFNTQITVTDTSNNTATAEGVANVSTQPLTILGTVVPGFASQSTGTVPVANFIDPNSVDVNTQFSALVGWGDGDSSLGMVEGGPNQFTVLASHQYASPGTYTTFITVVGQGNLPGASATGTANISPSGITLNGQAIVGTVGQPFTNVAVASISDSNMQDTADQFTALISWGDGQATPGTVTGSSGSFTITGSHTYVSPGSIPITTTLTDQAGDTFSTTSTATVLNTATSASFPGGLAPIPGNGPNAAAGYSITNRPTFSGTAAPFATVELFASPAGIDVNNSLGFAIASATGQWTLATGPLADGIYSVTAVVTPPGGYPSLPQAIANNGRLVIDMIPPQVESVTYSGSNQVTVLFRDDLSGMNLASLAQTSNYVLAGPRLRDVHPSTATVLSSGLPTGVQEVVLSLPGGRRNRGQIRGISINGTNQDNNAGTPDGSGITDNAGNPLLGFSQGLLSFARARTIGKRKR